jgi:hypothetical protein
VSNVSGLSRVLGVEELEGRIVPTLLGQQLFPADYPWNQNISNAPVASNSQNIISAIGGSIGIHPDWGDDSASNGASPLYGIPFNVVHGNTAQTVNVTIDNYPGESDHNAVPIPAGAVIEGDFQNGPNPNGGGYNTGQRGDSHLIVWDVDNNIAYELYGVTRPTDRKLFPDRNGVEQPHTDSLWHAAQESVWNMKTDSFRSLGYTSADAAGLSILAGLVRPDEGLPTAQGGQGAINHALRFTLPAGDVNDQYIYPASHVVGSHSSSTSLPMGARLRLQNTPAVNTIINGLGPQAQIIAHAMQQYGLVLADIGSAMYVTGASASVNASNAIQFTWNMNDVLGLHALIASDFDVVDLTPQVTGLSANSASTGSTITVTGKNFSGAAGHLQVLFGSTPATSVTVVDDSHVTAVVPSGSGTVHVQVQSGVNATDPNNPSDNVNAPIFGYGLSTTSTADQFTFITQTISGSNSTASFASSAVAAGSTDTLTIVVKDTSGNIVSGLTSSTFGLHLSGNSAGTFGLVTETATRGTYTTVFTATTAGTASTLTITVNGVTLTTTPTVQVTVPPPPHLPAAGTALAHSLEHYQLFVKNAYTTYLGRPATPAEVAAWASAMQNGLTDERLEASFIGSPEYIANHGGPGAGWVTGMYKDLLGRTPSSFEVNAWVAALNSGVSPQQVAYGFAVSGEREGRRINDDYQTFLGRPATPAEVNAWVMAFQGGVTNEDVIAGFIGSAEYFDGHGQGTDAGWVSAAFHDVLNRAPTPAEVTAWVALLG